MYKSEVSTQRTCPASTASAGAPLVAAFFHSQIRGLELQNQLSSITGVSVWECFHPNRTITCMSQSFAKMFCNSINIVNSNMVYQ